MYWLFYIGLVIFQPLETAEQEKMAAFIATRVNPRATFYARPLVRAIYREADRKNLDPTVLAAIVWNESWYDKRAKGSSHERGLWQIWPWASPALDIGWAELRKMKLTGSLPDKPWKALPLRTRHEASLDIDIGAYLAVTLIAMLRSYCIAKKHDHRRPTDKYAHYNVGYRYPRPGYSHQLWKRTKIIRRVIGRPAVTVGENAWMNRVVPGG